MDYRSASRIRTLAGRFWPLTTTRALQLYQLLRHAAILATSILLAKSGLSMAMIGVYELLLYTGTLVSFFWINGLLQAMTPVFGRLAQTDRPSFFFNVFLVFVGLSALVTGLLYLGMDRVVPLITGQASLPFFGAYLAYLFMHLPTYPVEYIYLLRKKPLYIAWWGLFSFGMQVLAVVAPLLLGYGLGGSVQALCWLGGLRLLWTVGVVVRYGQLRWRADLIRKYLVFAMPLMLNVLVGNLILIFDSWLVGWWYKDQEVFALFRYGARELPLAQALMGGLGVAIIPRLQEDFTGGMRDLRQMSLRLFHVLFPMSLVLMAFCKPLFPVVFNPDFAAAAPIFSIYLLLVVSRVLLPNSIVLAIDHPRVLLYTSLLELGIKAVAGFWFVSLWGLEGLAWSAVIAFWTEKGILGYYLYKRHGVRVADWLSWRTYLVYTLLLGVSYWVF